MQRTHIPFFFLKISNSSVLAYNNFIPSHYQNRTIVHVLSPKYCHVIYIVLSCYHHRVIALTHYHHRIVALSLSCFPDRNIVLSQHYHRTVAFLLSDKRFHHLLFRYFYRIVALSKVRHHRIVAV